MAVSKIRRQSAAYGQTGYPNANTIRVDSDTDTAFFGTGASGSTEREIVDVASAQTISGVKTFTAAPIVSEVALTVTGAEAGDATLNIQADQGDDNADKWAIKALAASETLEVSNSNTTAKVNVTAGQVAVVGTEAGTAALALWADEGDDTADKWAMTALAASQTLEVTNSATTAKHQFAAGEFGVLGAEAGDAKLTLDADEGDDNADTWFIQSTASDNDLDFINHTTTVANLSSGGNLAVIGSLKSSSASGGIGYATGAGGTVTQATSRTTGVTINTPTGAITLVSAAGSATAATFTVTNSAVAATDTVHVCQKSGTDLYHTLVTAVGAGSFNITFFTTGGTTTEQPVFNFNVLKGVAA